MLKPARGERREKRAGIAIAEIDLASGGRVQPIDGNQGNAACAIPTPREPHRVVRLVIRGFDERIGALVIGARKMTGRAETLWMELELETGMKPLGEFERA